LPAASVAVPLSVKAIDLRRLRPFRAVRELVGIGPRPVGGDLLQQ